MFDSICMERTIEMHEELSRGAFTAKVLLQKEHKHTTLLIMPAASAASELLNLRKNVFLVQLRGCLHD